MKLDKNKKLAIFITLFSILVLSGITYTYFSMAVSNTNNEKFSTQTATLSLVFDDNDNGVNASLNLGQSIVKKFTIENTGTVDAYGKINWVDLVNTYMDGSLTWKLESSTTENGIYTIIKDSNVPTSTSATTTLLRDGLLVPEGETIYYKLTITLNNLDVDQSSDINAVMHSKFNLEAGKPILTAVQQIRNLASNGNPNSTESFNGPVQDKYALNFNNAPISTEYNIDICQGMVSFFRGKFGSNASFVCQQNPNTNSYEIIANGDSRYSSYIYDDLQTCEENHQEYNNSNITCKKVQVSCNTFAYDGTEDNNLRYVGESPCNYISFSSTDDYYRMYRIIGVMNNVDDGTGKLENRLKVMSLYYSDEETWGPTNDFNSSFIYQRAINNTDDIALQFIGKAKINLKSFPSTSQSILAGELYELEKNTGSVFPGNSTSSVSPFFLPLPSDLFEAVGGNDRNACLNKNIVATHSNSQSDYVSDCKTKNWIMNGDSINSNMDLQDTVLGTSDTQDKIWEYYPDEGLIADSCQTVDLHIVGYLKSNIEIIGGSGTYYNPYIIN